MCFASHRNGAGAHSDLFLKSVLHLAPLAVQAAPHQPIHTRMTHSEASNLAPIDEPELFVYLGRLTSGRPPRSSKWQVAKVFNDAT